MAIHIVFNELSISRPAPSIEIARKWMAEFITTLVSLSHWKIRIFRVLPDFHFSILAPDYPLPRWRHDPEVDREQRRFLLSLETKLQDLDPTDDHDAFIKWQGCDVSYNGQPAPGLATAYFVSGIAVSLASDDTWKTPSVAVDLSLLIENGDLKPEQASVVHASCPDHIESHTPWIESRLRITFENGADVWRKRADAFPHLIFCGNVEGQLNDIQAGNPWFNQVLRRLKELDDHCNNWESGAFDPAQLHNATPESMPTLRTYADEHTLRCPDNINRLFSWHLRLTPNNGRIYFFPMDAARTIIVGHVGAHLPTVLYH